MTTADTKPTESKELPTILVSDRQARVLSGMMTLICTVYFTVLLWVFVVLPCAKLLSRFFGLFPF